MIITNPLALAFLAFMPAVVLLHSRSMRWIPVEVSSLHLWEDAGRRDTRELRLRAPLRSLSLVLQLLAVAALSLALARPVRIEAAAQGRGDTILVLDATASMNARESDGTRYDEAKKKALGVLSTLRRGARMLIIQAGRIPRLLLPFDGDPAEVRQAIMGSEATDEAGTLRDSILLARSLDGTTGKADIVVVTDGAFDSLGGIDVDGSGLTFIPVGTSRANVAITSFQFRRTVNGPDFELLASVQNFSSQSVSSTLAVTVGSVNVIRAPLSLAPGQLLPLSFPYAGPTDGPATAELDVSDDLAVDNRAYAFFTPSRRLSILLAGSGNYFLESALGVLPNVTVRKISAQELLRESASADGSEIVVADGVEMPPALSGNYMVFNTVPPGLPVQATGAVDNPRSITWDISHPIMESLDLKGLVVRRALRLSLQPGPRAVVQSKETPLVVSYETEGLKVLILGFGIGASDLPLRPAFPVFLANALSWFDPGWLSVQAQQAHVGASVSLPVPRGAESLSVVRPDGKQETFLVKGASVLTYAGTTRAGFYRVEDASAPVGQFAVTLSDASESRIDPRFVLKQAAGQSPASPGQPVSALERPLWTAFTIAALLILLCEWLAWVVVKR